MFNLLANIHFRVTRLLLSVNIGVRLFTLMGLAAIVPLLLAAAGILGLAASKERLRSVYKNRTLQIQQLAEIAKLMLTSRMLLQASLSEVSIGASASVCRVSTVFPSLLFV